VKFFETGYAVFMNQSLLGMTENAVMTYTWIAMAVNSPDCYSQETSESGYKPLHNSRDVQSDPFQKTPILQISSSIDDTQLKIVTCNQLSLYNIQLTLGRS
jgi:hypothetical protein